MTIKKVKRFLRRFNLLFVLAVMMIGIQLVSIVIQNTLIGFGIIPREIAAIPNILTAPFIHGSWTHLMNNLLGLFIFGSLCLVRSKQLFVFSSVYIIIVGGLLVWSFGRPVAHIGASGWVFGLWAVCICSAFIEKNLISIIIAFFVIAFYGSMIYGLLPGSPRISFESHVFGAVAGFFSLVYRPKWLRNVFKQ